VPVRKDRFPLSVFLPIARHQVGACNNFRDYSLLFEPAKLGKTGRFILTGLFELIRTYSNWLKVVKTRQNSARPRSAGVPPAFPETSAFLLLNLDFISPLSAIIRTYAQISAKSRIFRP
jgi:hypothetical protein